MADRIVPGPSLTAVATPVDRFVAPVQQRVGEDPMLQLSKALSQFNPKLTSFLEDGHERYKTEEEAKGVQAESYIDPSIALEKNRQGWKGLIDEQRRTDTLHGTNHADKLAAASPHFRRGLLKARAQRLGTGLNDHLAAIYSRNPTVQVGNSSVNLQSVDDPQVLQAWAQQEINAYAERFGLDQIDPVLVSEVFTPLAARAADGIASHHTNLRLERYNDEYMDEMSANAGLLLSYSGTGETEVSDFLQRLGISENSGRWGGTNSEGYTGLYQFGQDRLDDFNRANGTSIKLSQLDDSVAGRQYQQQLALWHIADIDKMIDAEGFLDKGWSRDGLRAVAHLGGKGGMQKFVMSGGDYNPKDSNGTRLSDYYTKFAGPAVDLQNQLDEAVANGIDPRKANTQIVTSVINAAVEQGSTELLGVLKDIDAGSGPLGNIGWVKEQVKAAEATIANNAWKAETRAHQIEEREREDSKRDIMTVAFGSLLEDPFADMEAFTAAALDSGNPELAKTITTFQETLLDNTYKVRTDPVVFNEIRYRVGSAASGTELDQIMLDAVTAGNAGLLSHTDVGGILDDVQRQRDNASVLSTPILRDYRSRLGSIVEDQRSTKNFMGISIGAKDEAFFAVSMFDVQMREFASANEGVSEASFIKEADRIVNEIMRLERFAPIDVGAADDGEDDTEDQAQAETSATTKVELPPETLELLKTEAGYPLLQTMADQAGMDVEEYAKSIGLFQ